MVLDDQEWRDFDEVARRHGLTLSDWVRATLRRARHAEPGTDVEGKLRAVAAAARHGFPAGPVEEMLDQIERGYRSGP